MPAFLKVNFAVLMVGKMGLIWTIFFNSYLPPTPSEDTLTGFLCWMEGFDKYLYAGLLVIS